MQLSITAVTKNRAFSKALSRHWDSFAGLQWFAVAEDLSELGLETLQIVFMDRAHGFVKPDSSLSKTTQVEVGIPENLDSYLGDDGTFAAFVKSAVQNAISAIALPSEQKQVLLDRLSAIDV